MDMSTSVRRTVIRHWQITLKTLPYHAMPEIVFGLEFDILHSLSAAEKRSICFVRTTLPRYM